MKKPYDHDCLLSHAKLKYIWLVEKKQFQLDAGR